MPPKKPLRFSGNVVDGRLKLDEQVDQFALPEGATVTLVVVEVVTDRCRTVFVPGIIDPPGNRMPRIRTRCTSQAGHEGRHSFEPQDDQSIGYEPSTQNEDADEN
jgi:hypothetical protein